MLGSILQDLSILLLRPNPNQRQQIQIRNSAMTSTSSSSSSPTKTLTPSKDQSKLDLLTVDVQKNITSFLDAGSLLTVRCLNRKWSKLAVQNDAGWTALCVKHLWPSKVHVCREAKQLLARNAMEAYKLSLRDARERQWPTLDEVTYDLESKTGTVWTVRFKETAGEDWTRWDPWYQHKPCRKMVLLRDGTVKMFLQRTSSNATTEDDSGSGNNPLNPLHRLMELRDPTWGREDGQEEGEEEDDDEIRGGNNNNNNNNNNGNRNDDLLVGNTPVPMRWRFITQPLDFPVRPEGSYIRFSVFGRDVPTYVSRRSPTGNWGFVFESCWGVWGSFELPPKPRRRRPPPRPLADQTTWGRVTTRSRSRATNRHLRSLNIIGGANDDNVDSDEEMISTVNNNNDGNFDENDYAPGERLLVDEDTFEVGPEDQWREAFLYNFGLDRLPEGPQAMEEFRAVEEALAQEEVDNEFAQEQDLEAFEEFMGFDDMEEED